MPTETCPTPGPVMLSLNKEQKRGRLWRPPCKRWSCPICGPQNAAGWGYVAMYGAQKLIDQNVRIAFVTITSHERLSADLAIQVWPNAWKKLYSRIKRQYGAGDYMMVTEKTKRGKLHVHAVVTWPVALSWLKDNARECGLGFQADVQPIEYAAGAAAYVAKYLTKSNYAWPTGWRRVRLSRGWPKPDEAEPMQGWSHHPVNGKLDALRIVQFMRDYESAGFEMRLQAELEREFGLK